MILSFSKVQKSFVFLSPGRSAVPVGMIFDCVINPEKGRIEGFWVKTSEGAKILPKDAIKQWKTKKMVLIDSGDLLLLPEEVQKMKSIFEKEVPLIGAKVWDRNQYLGTVYDFSFDVYSLFILFVQYKKGFWWWQKRRHIHRSKIVKINAQGVFVADSNIRTIADTDREEVISSVKAKKNV